MPGNSARRGAVRRGGTKKGAVVGSGGKRARGLRGKGPTPKATERTGHPAAERARGSRPTPTGHPRRKSSGGSELVAGRNSVLEALRAQIPARALLVAGRIDSDERLRESLKIATDRGLPVLEATRTDLDRLSNDAVHQGIALQLPPYDYAHPHDLLAAAQEVGQAPLLVALDGVTDPRNLGAVLRSVAAFGGHGAIVPERRAAGMTASAWKVSAGAAGRVRVARATNLTRALEDLKKAGCFVVGLDAEAPETVRQFTMARDPLVLVIGSEGKGLSRLVRETCDVVVSIPMAGPMESLNAGVAAGIALYEVARHR
ncbi:MAG: rRNA (guanosine2251-2-O)-methyltransferase, partial [Actinomycetota bacterium]|nr:rRNA (guanosine2251-2-O)-methyltransferase [Actinomycetota bacterium]